MGVDYLLDQAAMDRDAAHDEKKFQWIVVCPGFKEFKLFGPFPVMVEGDQWIDSVHFHGDPAGLCSNSADYDMHFVVELEAPPKDG